MTRRIAMLGRVTTGWRAFPKEPTPPEVELRAYTSSEELRRDLLEESFDAVIVDWRELVRSGESAPELRRSLLDCRTLPLIALCSDVREHRAASEANFDEVFPRVFSWHALVLRLDARRGIDEKNKRLEEAEDELQRIRPELERLRGSAANTAVTRDDLTGLANRIAVEKAIRGALASGVTEDRQLLVAFFDIDNFRIVNQTFGRHSGNEVLQLVAQRLVSGLQNEDIAELSGHGSSAVMVARIVGDQFALIASGVRKGAPLDHAVRGLQSSLAGTYSVGPEREAPISVCCGVAVAPRDGRSVEDLLSRAETACAEATATGPGVLRHHDGSSTVQSEEGARIGSRLASALARDEFELYFQPIVDAERSRVTAAEALLRWTHPELGPVSPGVFIPIAEERGLMPAIGEWVLRRALLELRKWLDLELKPIRVAVNVSIAQLAREDFVDKLEESLEVSGAPSELLELEISERGALRDDPEILARLEKIRELGCHLAIDDYGTGNTSIRYLKRFPLSTLKIDRSFVRDLASSEEDPVIVTAIAAMARQLGLRIVAEGVETRFQQDFLKRCACDELQGFLFSRPISSEEFRQLLLEASHRIPAPTS